MAKPFLKGSLRIYLKVKVEIYFSVLAKRKRLIQFKLIPTIKFRGKERLDSEKPVISKLFLFTNLLIA